MRWLLEPQPTGPCIITTESFTEKEIRVETLIWHPEPWVKVLSQLIRQPF
jgi:hypothetical protein